jgi:hypothetical protein
VDVQDIVDRIRYNRILITDHADEEAQGGHLSFDEILFSLLHGEMIQDYLSDKPCPSYLIYGDSLAGEPMHSVWLTITQLNGHCWSLCTDPERWIDWHIRRNR